MGEQSTEESSIASDDFDAIIVGAGPAGSTLSAMLAKAGHRVLVLDSAQFPRYHIGESMIPSGVDVLKETGVWSDVDGHGFIRKRGNTFVWGRSGEPWSISFDEARIGTYAYQVIRSEFDGILLGYSRRCGAEVRPSSRVQDLIFSTDGRCRGVLYADANGETRRARAPWTVDASGQACLIGRKLGLRVMDPVLNNAAMWSYYVGAERLPEPASGYTLSAAIDDGWIWCIPLHDGTMSVGVVTGIENTPGHGQEDRFERFYASHISRSDLVSRMLAKAKKCEGVRVMRDWSYHCDKLVGKGWLIVGDAAGFVDPVLSTGMGMALQAAYVGAKAIDACLVTGENAGVLEAYERFYHQYMGQFFDFVHYFYDANNLVESYYWKARRLVRPELNMTSRSAFIYLISGMNNAATGQLGRTRSFEMGVYENLGTTFGRDLLRLNEAREEKS